MFSLDASVAPPPPHPPPPPPPPPVFTLEVAVRAGEGVGLEVQNEVM